MSKLKARNGNLVTSLEKLHNSDDEVLQSMNEIFHKLKNMNVDPAVAEGKTLYDYVDIGK